MAFVGFIFTALKLRKLQKSLIEEKLDAIKADEDQTYKKKFKFQHIKVDIQVAFKKFFRKIFKCSENSPVARKCYMLRHEGSCENYVFKSVFGFIGGVLLTYLLYIFFIFQLNVKLTTATVVCSFLGCVLTVGLAFSSKVSLVCKYPNKRRNKGTLFLSMGLGVVFCSSIGSMFLPPTIALGAFLKNRGINRKKVDKICVVLLTLPQFFSKRGRQALLSYAFALALTGPAQNTLNNMGILSESLACGQEQLKQAVKQIIDVIKKPFVAIKEAIKKVIKTVREVVKKIKEILLKIKRIIMAIVRVIKSVFEFLGKIINICNKELGTPFERCSRVFENAIADCNAKMGPLFNWLCSLAYIVKAVCYIVKVFDYVCMIVDFISDSVVGVVIRKVKIFVRHIKTMFYVRIKFSHSFKFETKASKSVSQIAKAIVAELKDRTRGVAAFFNFMTSAVMLFFLYLIFQVTYYRIRYLVSEKFDNMYITKNFREIDQRRAKLGKETVLPLSKKEQQVYVQIGSASLVKKEKKNLSKAVMSLSTASVKLGTHMIADYCLYWILTMITYHGRYQSKIQAPNMPVAHITGEGFIAKLLRSIVNAFQPVGIKLEIDTVPCLPIPIPPDFDRYVQIAVTLLICWILTVLEPYGLRFRSYIMGYYHPLRAKQRTIWLYNHILRSRSSFLLFARRQLRRKFGAKGIDQVSCKDHFRAHLNGTIFSICLGGGRQEACLLCGEVFRENDQKKFVKCHTPGCAGLFCLECFADLKNICPICLSPIEYGDLDDLDEEKDSSGDEQPKKPKKKRKCPWFPCGKPDNDDDDDDEEKPPTSDEEEEKKQEEAQEKESGSSSDFSSGYQYDEDQQDPYPKPMTFKDVEKQDIPDYASMESFRDQEEIISIDLDNRIRVPKGHAAVVQLDVSAIISDENGEEDPNDVGNEENEPLLEVSTQCICPDSSDRHVEFIGVPEECRDVHKSVRRKIHIIPSDSMCCCSDLDLIEHLEETSLITLPKSTMSTSTRTDCRFCRPVADELCSSLGIGTETEEELRNIVPKLDLSFLDKDDQTCACDNPILSHRFRHVTYEEICETPPSSLTDRTLESSSILSSLEDSPRFDKEETPLLRKRNIMSKYTTSPSPGPSNPTRYDKGTYPKQRNAQTQYRTQQEMDSPSSMDSYDFNRAQNRKVRRYYETANRKSANRQLFDDQCQCHEKGRSIRNVFRKLIPKGIKEATGKSTLSKGTLPLVLRRNSKKIRNRGLSYLPLHRRDVDDDVEVRSYNYHQDNWDTLSLDTDSPTYPFGNQISSDTSEEDRRHLLSGRRIRGGECTHLVNCKLIGRSCRQKRTRSFDAKSRTFLKDFSSLSLPPKPKPANTKEFLNRCFQKTENSPDSTNAGIPMKSLEAIKHLPSKRSSGIIAKKESSDYQSAISSFAIIDEDNTPPSSDSVISLDTCAELLGDRCPRGLEKQSSPYKLKPFSERAELKDTEEPVQNEEDDDQEREEDNEEENQTDNEEKEEDNDEAEIEKGGKSGREKEEQGGEEEELALIEATPQTDIKKGSVDKSDLDKIATDISESKGDDEKASNTEKDARQSSQETVHSLHSNQVEEQPSTSQIGRSSAKRKSTQLNSLLYKDDKTEISLVQKLSPDQRVTKSRRSPRLSTQLSPSVKLQIALHNSIIKEEAELPEADQGAIEMRSPKSSDKIMETQETFPLRHEWISSEDSSKTGKLILASDKSQQTSDNNIYRSSNNSLITSSERKMLTDARPSSAIPSSTLTPSRQKVSSTSHQRYSSSDPRYTSTDPYYTEEEPERDPNCINNNCRCSKCREKQEYRGLPARANFASARRGCDHNCCKCSNPILEDPMYPRTLYQEPVPPPVERSYPVGGPREQKYRIKTMLPNTTDSEPLEFLPPPPPPPRYLSRVSAQPSPPRQRPKVYSEPCYEECNCCANQRQRQSFGYSGDFENPPTSNRYPDLRARPNYGRGRAQGYNDVSDSDPFDYSNSSNRKPSLTELPYQNNEEYLELVEELQDTLHTRNRNRVKRAMQEFEDRSKHNKPLDKPIIDYDETSESEEPIIRKIDQLRTDRKICCAGEQCGCIKQRSPPGYSEPAPRQEFLRRERFDAGERPSHWTIDSSSGEWSKACRCSKRGPKGSKGRGAPPNRCSCTCERSRYQ